MINFDFEPVVDTTVFNRRDITQYFSYKFTSDLKLGSLISNLISPSFELPQFERLVGWIGEQDHIDNNYYYKISESTPDRHNYQLAPFIVSVDDNENIQSSVHYVDIFNNLKSQGALTDNINRLVRSKNKTWCPPINPDMLANFMNYCWSPFGTKIYEIHGIKYTEDQYNRSFESSVIKQIILDKNKFKSQIDPTEQKEYIFEFQDNFWFLAQSIVFLTEYGITYNLDTGVSKPNNGDRIIVEFIPAGTSEQTDISETLIGQKQAIVTLDTYIEVYDDTTGETKLVREEVEVKNGMRFRFYNDKNLDYNDIVYLINGVGSSIELQDDREYGDIYEIESEDELLNQERKETTKRFNLKGTALLYKWNYNEREWLKYEENDKGEGVVYKMNPEATSEEDRWIFLREETIDLTPNYITIQRLSKDDNDWSRGNRWFSILLFNNDSTLYNYFQRKATHQIIEFKRNIKLYDCGTNKVSEVDCYYRGNIGSLYGQINGYKVPVHSTDPSDPDNVLMFDGMRILVKDTTSSNSSEQIWEVSGLSLGISTLSLIDIVFEDNDEVYVKNKNGYKKGLLYWKNGEFKQTQNREINLEEYGHDYPLFELYDENYISLTNDEKYADLNFKGSRLFGYENNNYITYINYMYQDLNGNKGYFWYFDKNKYSNFLIESDRFVESNYIQYFYVSDPTIYDYALELAPSSISQVSINTTDLLESKYVYNPPMVSINRSVTLNENDIIKVSFKYDDDVNEELQNAFLEVSKLVTTSTNNLDIKEINYSVLLSQLVDIIGNQEGFEGNPYSQNNFYSTAQDISIGTKLFNSYSRFNKLAIINNMNNVDIRSVITKIGEKYEEFKRRFVQRVEQISNTNEFTYESDIVEIVSSVLNYLNMGKLEGEAFYNNGVISDTSYIPATPSYLGMLPCIKPYVKNNGRILVGHDGSETYLKFGDWRDNALIELENEIYDSINPIFKDTLGTLEYKQYIPTANNKCDYSVEEYNQFMSGLFSKWFALHQDETFSNLSLSDDPFTWNWSSCIDFQGNRLLGHYRGIYNYFYGTYRPDECPWEMLGFFDKPEWWDDTYGEAPYTSNNLVMWEDIAKGIIRKGANAGQYDYLKRDYLLNIIPTDEDGNLLPPNRNGITQQSPIYVNAAKGFKFGDGSDAEYDWWQTSEYKYALMCATYLMKPGFWLEYTWDTLSEKDNYKLSNVIHNSQVNGKYQKVIGSAQWISDYLCLNGISISKLEELLSKIEVRLGYRVGGYIDSGNLTIKNTKQDTLLSSYYDIITYKSAVVKSVSLSNMSIAWVDGKYIVFGSDINSPYFNVLTPDTLQNYTYDNSTNMPILYFKSWSNKGETVPYYTVVDTVQEVYNIIRGYGKYLESIGFIYENYEDNSQTIINWDKMAKNFLKWVESSEKEDRDVLTLSPWNIINYESNYPYSYISFNNNFGVVDNICSYTNNVWNIIDIEGNALLPEDVEVYRQINGVVIKTKDLKQIAYLHLNIYTQENAIIFDTIQDNGFILYDELNGEYIKNLYIESVRTAVWDGGLYAPGLILNDDKLIYNYTKRAYNFKDYYNIDSITSVEPLGIIAKSITGYNRDILLNEIFANENSEFDFYNAQKLDKGSFNVVKALRRLPNMQNLDVFEIFALLEDEYGETNNYKEWEIKAQNDWKLNNPQIFTVNTYKSYKDFLEVHGNPLIINDILYSTKQDEEALGQENGYLKSKNIFSPYGFKWFIKIKLSIDSVMDDIRPVITCSNNNIPFLFVEDKHLSLYLHYNTGENTLADKIIKTDDLRLGDSYFVEYGWNGSHYYLILSTDLSDNNTKKYISEPITLSEQVYDSILYVGVTIENNNVVERWNNGKIYLSFYDNSLDENIKETKKQVFNLVYSDSKEWIKQAEFLSDNRFKKIEDESKYMFLPYIPLLKESETDYKIITKDEIENLLSNNDIKSSDKILVTFDNNSWDLLQLKEVNSIKSIEYNDEVDLYQNTAVFETQYQHNLFEGEIIEIKSDKDEAESWEGVQTVLSVVDETHFTIATTIQHAETFEAGHYPIISGIVSRKFSHKSDIFANEETGKLKSDIIKPEIGDLIYVERDNNTLYRVCDDLRHVVKVREKQPKIDTNLIQQVLIYDSKNPLKYTCYEIFDPFKYQVDLEVKKNIKYLNYEDPAIYNINNVTQEETLLDNWTESHIGEIWWDISQCKYYDYEIEDDVYRSQLWGKLAYGSELKVYEWVKSPVAPSEYSSAVASETEVNGTKLSGNPIYTLVEDTKVYKYNIKKLYNNETKEEQLWYYFWVENTQYVPNIKNRTLTTSSIINRLNVDVNKTSWFAPISSVKNPDLSYTSSFILANIEDLKNNDNILQIKYELRESKLPLHKDWVFFHKALKETRYLGQWEKFKDSLAGYDKVWQLVPDIILNDTYRHGNKFFPRQSMLIDKREALKSLIQKINDMLIVKNIDKSVVDEFNIRNYPVISITRNELYEDIVEDDIKFVFKVEDLEYNNYKKVNSFNAIDVHSWKYEDAPIAEYIRFDNKEPIPRPKYIVNSLYDMDILIQETGVDVDSYIYVDSDENYDYGWTIYKVLESGKLELYEKELYKMSDFFKYVDWYSSDIDNFNVIKGTYKTINDIEKDTDYSPVYGDLVKLTNSNNNKWSIVQYNNFGWVTVANQDGTIQITDKIFDIDISDPLSENSKLYALIVRNILNLFEN